MKNKSHPLLKLTLIYFFISVILLLFFQLSLIIAIFSIFPTTIKVILINIFKSLSSFELIKNPPFFLQLIYFFVVMELPFVLLGFTTSYLILRKRYKKKYHLLAATFSLLGILMLSSFTVIKPIGNEEYKSPGFFSVQLSLRELKCNSLSKQSIFNWTYPVNGQTNVSIHSPVVVNPKNGVKIRNGCDPRYVDGKPAYSHNMLGNVPGINIPLVPEGGNSISELDYLSKASLIEIKNFASMGSWDNNKTIAVTCHYIKSDCSGSESFIFSTGDKEETN